MEPEPVPIPTPVTTPLPTPTLTPISSEARAESARNRVLGLELRGQGRLAEAIAALETSVQLDPDNLNGRVILGWTLHLAGQAADAEAALQGALEIDETHVPALNALGIVYLVDGQLDRAVETHWSAIALGEENEVAHYNLSLAYQRLGNYTEAIARAQRATELERWNPHPWVALAIAHWSAEDVAAANYAYRQALQLDSRYSTLEYLNHLSQAGFNQEQIQLTASVLASLRR